MKIKGSVDKVIGIKRHYQMFTSIVYGEIRLVSANVYYSPASRYLSIKGKIKNLV